MANYVESTYKGKKAACSCYCLILLDCIHGSTADTIDVKVVYKHGFIITSIVLGKHLKALWQVAQKRKWASLVVRNPGIEAKGVEAAESKNG